MDLERLKRWFLMPLVGLIFAISTLLIAPSTPVYADPILNSPTVNDPTNPTPTNPATPADPTDPNNQNPTPTTDNSADTTSCTSQIGALGWLICPGTGFLSNAIDALYGVIEDLLAVEPLSSNTDTPIFVIWNYARNISNIVFVIFILIIVYSQVTGLGLSNYSIKRTLPRIIIAAILVNLSYFICSLAVDLSNIIGASLRDFLSSVGESALASNPLNSDLKLSVADVFATIASGGAILGVSIAVAGGLSPLLIAFIPVIIGGIISLAVGLLTISLRQSVVSLLIMISPLAFIAYLLPNTEKFFKKWYEIFFQMLVFYPMFSLLFGASRLAGWTIISSAKDGFGIILGIAVQIFPLFLGLSLMKMSGSVLGGISGFFAGVGARATNASRDVTGSYRALRRARYLAQTPKKFDIPRRLAQGVQDRRNRRAYDTAEYESTAKQRGIAYANLTYRRNNGTGGLTNRGRLHADLNNRNMQYSQIITSSANDFDEGVAQFEKKGTRNYKRAVALDNAAVRASDRLKFEQARTTSINLNNSGSFAQRVIEADATFRNSGIKNTTYRDIHAITKGNESGINTIVANAISTRKRVDNEVTNDYVTLFQETPLTAEVQDYLVRSLGGTDPSGRKGEKDANIAEASIRVMMQRGDTDLVAKILGDLSPNISDLSDSKNLVMQKRLSDVMISFKPDAVHLWGYAKALNVARAKAEGVRRANKEIAERNKRHIAAGEPVEQLLTVPDSFIEFADYLRPDGIAANLGLDLNTMAASTSESVMTTQDRTVSGYGKEMGILIGTETQRRNQLFSGLVDGEKLSAAIDMHLGRGSSWNYQAGNVTSDKSHRNILTFVDIKDNDGNVIQTAAQSLEKARENIRDILRGNNAGHFLRFKSAELDAFLPIMDDDNYTIDSDGKIVFNLKTGSKSRDEMIVSGLKKLTTEKDPKTGEPTIDTTEIIADFKKQQKRGNFKDLNKTTRALLNRVFHFE